MQAYKFFRVLTFLCLFAIIAISGLFLFGTTDEKSFGVISGVVAIAATVFGIFASKPIDKKDVTGAVDQLLLTYEKDTYASLQEAKKEEKTLREFIENRSEELLLLKMRTYLEQEVKNRYEELLKVENRLDAMNVQYGALQMPERFKRLMQELDEGTQRELWQKVIVEIFGLPMVRVGFPFVPESVTRRIAYLLIDFWSERLDIRNKKGKMEDGK